MICGFFLSGKLIQKSYYESIARINNNPSLKVNLLSYERGIFVSNAKITIEIGADNLSDAQVIPVTHTITHGPIIAALTPTGHSIKFLAGQVKTNLGEHWEKKLEEYTTTKNPLSIVTLVKFNNFATTWIRLAGSDQKTETQFHVGWEPINGIISHNLNFTSYTGEITIPKIQVDNPQWQFLLQNMTFNLDANNNSNENYSSSNTFKSQLIAFTKNNKDIVKLNNIDAKLSLTAQNNNLSLSLLANVPSSHIVETDFQNDTVKLQANNLNREILNHLPRLDNLSAKDTVDLLQNLTVASTDLTLELPKQFTESLISYISFELYRSSYLGKFDNRPENTVLQDISGSINKLVQGAVQKNIIVDTGTHYALNFNNAAQTQPQS